MSRKKKSRVLRRRVFVGIDPGTKGAVAVVTALSAATAVPTPVQVQRIKSPRARTAKGRPRVKTITSYCVAGLFTVLERVAAMHEKGHRVLVAVERQGPRLSTGKSAVMKIGIGLGYWQAVLELLDLPYVFVTPSAWKPHYVAAGSGKKESLAMARSLFPSVPLLLEKDEGRAEALLIADYLRRRELNLPYPIARRKRPRKGLKTDEDLQQQEKELRAAKEAGRVVVSKALQ
jgi:hypothetical protein